MGKEINQTGPENPGRRWFITRVIPVTAGLWFIACHGNLDLLVPPGQEGGTPEPTPFPYTPPKLEKVVVGSQERTRQEFEALRLVNPLFPEKEVRIIDATTAQSLENRNPGNTLGIKSLVFHHTACRCLVETTAMDINHLIYSSQVKGASPYNAVIAKDGTIFLTTKLDTFSGSLEPKDGLLLNEQTFNIALDGNFEEEETPEIQRQSLQFLIYLFYHAFGLKDSNGIDGRGGIILGHKETPDQRTFCPGKNLLPKYLGGPERITDIKNMVGWSIVRGKFAGPDQEALARLIYQKTKEHFDPQNRLYQDVLRFIFALCFSESSFRTSEDGLPILSPNVVPKFEKQTTFDCGPFQVNSKYQLGNSPSLAVRALFDIDFGVEEGVKRALKELERAKFAWIEAAWGYKGKTRDKWIQATQVAKEMFGITLEDQGDRLLLHFPQIGKEFLL